jgi:glycyl-tRNA synthetase beta chain
MGGIYAREQGLPEEVWKAIYYHYLPIGVEADAPPSRAQLGKAAIPWTAVSLADKLDTIVGLFAAGEKPTGSRDPFGLRRAAQAVVKMAVDLQATIGHPSALALLPAIDQAFAGYGGSLTVGDAGWKGAVTDFLTERLHHLLERRGYRYDEIRAVLPGFRAALRPATTLRRVEALAQARKSVEFEGLAVLFKRVKNITKDVASADKLPGGWSTLRASLREPAELALVGDLEARWPRVESALEQEQYLDAMHQVSHLRGPVDRFFADVLVMADDPTVRQARLALLTALRQAVEQIADISEIVPDETKQS